MNLLDKLSVIEEKYRGLEALMGDPSVVSDVPRLKKVSREHASLSPLISKIREYRRITDAISEDEEALLSGDDELREIASGELPSLREQKEALDRELPVLLLPKDPNDERNVIVEIRGGVGGEEAALFAADLFRMYTRFAERHGWHTSLISSNPTELGGFKEIIFSVEGCGAFSRLKYERGTHRVQRVPETESGGRIHTSAATVAILPEADEIEADIRPEELRIDTYRAQGAGGQYVNRTESAVRITHIPTGITVQCQDEKSQLKNKAQAMRILRARIMERAAEEQSAGIAEDRKRQIGTGDRSGRVRTYNFPQGRVTDHRIGLTLHRLHAILDGELDEITDALIAADRAEQMKSGSS